MEFFLVSREKASDIAFAQDAIDEYKVRSVHFSFTLCTEISVMGDSLQEREVAALSQGNSVESQRKLSKG